MPPVATASTPASSTPLRAKLSIGATVAALVSIDFATKAWATSRLSDYSTIEVVRGTLAFQLAKNFAGRRDPSLITTMGVISLVVSTVVICAIMVLCKRSHPMYAMFRWSLPIMFAGTIGNSLDRLRTGYIVDFIDIQWTQGGRTVHWPTFNLADVFICIGFCSIPLTIVWAFMLAFKSRCPPRPNTR